MRIEILKKELASLGAAERKKLVAYLLNLEAEQNSMDRPEASRKIEEKESHRWMSLNEFDRYN